MHPSIGLASNEQFAHFACMPLMDNALSRLPSLDLLRGFVAVARRLSVTGAAADLFLTQSAVSRQIRGLEEHLGVPLFVRRHRGLELTADGERLFRSADAWLSPLGDQIDAIRQRSALPAVTFTATIGAVSLWLCRGSAASRPGIRASTCGFPPATGWSISTARASTWRCATPRRPSCRRTPSGCSTSASSPSVARRSLWPGRGRPTRLAS